MAAPVTGTTAGTFTSSNSITINKPSGVVSGDLMIALLGQPDGDVNWPVLAGWTKIRNIQQQNLDMQTYYKIAGGSEPASYTWTTVGNFDDKVGGIFKVTGHKDPSPIDVSASNGAYNKQPVAPAVTSSESTDILRLRFGVSYSPELWMTTGQIFSYGDNIHAVAAEDAATTGTAVPTRNFDTYDFNDDWVTQTIVVLPAADEAPQAAIMMGANF